MLKTLSVKAKVAIGFGMILLILLTASGVSYYSSLRIGQYSTLVESVTGKYMLAAKLEGALDRRISSIRGYLLTGKDKQLQQYTDAKKDFASIEEEYQKTVATENGKRMLASVHEISEAYRAAVDRSADLRTADKTKEAVDLYFSDQTSQLRAQAHDAIMALAAHEEKRLKDTQEQQLAMETWSRNLALALGIGGLLLGGVIAFVMGRWFSGSVVGISGFAKQLRENDLTIADIPVTTHDEIGQALVALNGMKNNLHGVVQSISETALHVASASEELSNTSQQISANSEETSAQAKVVSDSAGQVSQNLQTVATGAEEMGSSIKEIAKNATEAARVATSAVKVAETTTATVSKLGDSSNEIGQVIKVITSIAQQTNLLALNATIEAARAGEAGKGFAVVANEVKELAKETAKATEDISRKIEAIQTDTKAAVVAIASISEVINQVNGISNTIATAVEEQNATTNEMSRNVSEAAHGSGEITSNIAGVAQAAESTSRGAGDTQKAAQQLVETSAELRRLVEQFKINANDQKSGAVHSRAMAAHAGA